MPDRLAVGRSFEGGDRRSIRLHGYDYSQAGAYFVTICAFQRECLFGLVNDATVELTEAGRVVGEEWHSLPARFPDGDFDAFVVMPNHVHGIIVCRGIDGKGAASSAPTLSRIIRVFKSLSAIRVNQVLLRRGKPLWQRKYYEHIVRDEHSLYTIQEYIATNPLRWSLDRENPARQEGGAFATNLLDGKAAPPWPNV